MTKTREEIQRAIQWLGEEQPDTAILSHHGIRCEPVIQRCHVRLAPVGAAKRPVFIFEIAQIEYYENGEPTNLFTDGEIQDFSALLQTCGASIFDAWNGARCGTASFSLREVAGLSLRAAIERYSRGCPIHPKEGVFCRCGWLKAGYAALRLPEGWS